MLQKVTLKKTRFRILSLDLRYTSIKSINNERFK